MLDWLKEKIEDLLTGKPRGKRKKTVKRRKPVRVKRVTRKKKAAKRPARKKVTRRIISVGR